MFRSYAADGGAYSLTLQLDPLAGFIRAEWERMEDWQRWPDGEQIGEETEREWKRRTEGRKGR